MNLKRNSLIALISGFLISICGFLTPLLYLKTHTAQNGAVGIIGGAGAPTYTFMLSVILGG